MNWHIGWILLWIAVNACKNAAESEKTFTEQFAPEGRSYIMKCPETDSNNYANVTTYTMWSVNGRPPRGPKYKLFNNGLVIRNVSKEDTFANYTCAALDPQTFLPIRSENIMLKLRQRGAKSIDTKSGQEGSIESKVQTWGIVGQWKTLQCRVISRPHPTFIWTNKRTGEKIGPVADLYKIMEDDFSSNLTIFIQNDGFFGEYICYASNVHGGTTQSFWLSKGFKPKSPFMFPSFIGRDKIVVKVQPPEETTRDPNLPIKTYFVQFVEAGSLNSDENANIKAGNNGAYRRKWTTVSREVDSLNKHNTETFELKNLKENTTYMLRSAVGNSAAISDFSSSIRISTDSKLKSDSKQETEATTKERSDYGRSTYLNDSPLHDSPSIGGDCTHPKFRKTIIITTTSTTLIESIENGIENHLNEKNSSLVKKRVEEDTSISRVNLCSLI